MNKASYNIIFVVSFYMILSCGNTKNSIIIKQENNEKPVILRINKNLKKITGIKLPFDLTIINKNHSKEEFIEIKYAYGFKEKGVSIELFENNLKISNNSKKSVFSDKNLNYSIYTRHFTDSTETTQKQLKPYIDRMITQNKDTLHIGTVATFKIKHKELFEKLTKNDSLSIQFLDGKKFGEKITVPVKW